MARRLLVVSLLLTLVGVSPLLSHDFWLVPVSFRTAPGAEVVVRGQTSSEFPTTLSAVTPDRVASARMISASGTLPISGVVVGGTSLRLSHRPKESGQALVAVALRPRTLRESPESFRRYLVLEGAPEALARYEQQGILPTDSITRRYTKYAKALLEVGTASPRIFSRSAGHPLEFIPLSDPSAVRSGESLRMRMLFNGKPLADARGHVSVAQSVSSERAYQDVPFETDARGEFSIVVQGNGLWNARALHIVPAPAGSGADWDVHWATLVWWVVP